MKHLLLLLNILYQNLKHRAIYEIHDLTLPPQYEIPHHTLNIPQHTNKRLRLSFCRIITAFPLSMKGLSRESWALLIFLNFNFVLKIISIHFSCQGYWKLSGIPEFTNTLLVDLGYPRLNLKWIQDYKVLLAF